MATCWRAAWRSEGFFKEIMGKRRRPVPGRGGSMHVADMSMGIIGANGIVGAGIPIAVGSALAHQVRRTGGVAVTYFGDGAMAEGVLHESLNLAALWKLPVLFVCENNGWSEFSPTARQFAAPLQKLAGAFGIGFTCRRQRRAGRRRRRRAAVAALRAGHGPRVLECMTHRVRGHFEGDAQKYRAGRRTRRRRRARPDRRGRRGAAQAGVATADIATTMRRPQSRIGGRHHRGACRRAAGVRGCHRATSTRQRRR
jgi:TPP-dependent pyruvate/acetoin dehydrogenase alpha subunit